MDKPQLETFDQVVDHVLVLSDNPQLDDALIQRLQYDLATKTHNYETIARRYGLKGEAALLKYLKLHPIVVEGAKKLRALFHSDESMEQRIRMRFLSATETLIAPLQHLVADPNTPIAARIDGFKQLQRGAGVDGAPRDAPKGGVAGGSPFVLNINFKNGLSTRISGTTVLDADEIPSASPMSLADDEDDEFVEDV